MIAGGGSHNTFFKSLLRVDGILGAVKGMQQNIIQYKHRNDQRIQCNMIPDDVAFSFG